MLTVQACIDSCRLTEKEIAAIAGHELGLDAVALEMEKYLCIATSGERRLSCKIVDDINAATRSGDLRHAATLRRALQHFLQRYAGITIQN